MPPAKPIADETTPRNNLATRPIVALRLPLLVLLVALAAAPFLLTPIPPLTDVPGHIGQFSVQTAPAGEGLWRYFSFHWAPTLNLASDLLVEALHRVTGVVPAVWLLCAATPALTVIGIGAIARATNRRGAYALPWSLLFVFNYPFLWGFLNFALTEALSLVALAAWISLDGKRRWRAVVFVLLTPILLIGHGVAGVAGVGMIVGYTAWQHGLHRPGAWRGKAVSFLAAAWPPIAAGALALIVWKSLGSSDTGTTAWIANRKIIAVLHMLQDQNQAFDIGSVACALLVWLFGWWSGARLRGGPAGAVTAAIVLFVVAPSLLSGSDQIDIRLAPLVPMLAFAMQDWSAVRARRRRSVLFAGFALLAARFAVTIVSFQGYAASYARELVALDHIAPGSRVMNLTLVQCEDWRSARLEHLSNLATTYRGAWVNSHWSVRGLQLLQVKYRPSPLYYDDPSQMVFPDPCVGPAGPSAAGYRANQTVVQAARALPLSKVDYLWIIGAHLPSSYRDTRLHVVWRSPTSELYQVSAAADSGR